MRSDSHALPHSRSPGFTRTRLQVPHHSTATLIFFTSLFFFFLSTLCTIPFFRFWNWEEEKEDGTLEKKEREKKIFKKKRSNCHSFRSFFFFISVVVWLFSLNQSSMSVKFSCVSVCHSRIGSWHPLVFTSMTIATIAMSTIKQQRSARFQCPSLPGRMCAETTDRVGYCTLLCKIFVVGAVV